MTTTENVTALIELARQGKFLEAIERFYAPDAIMQENMNQPRAGLATHLENERNVLAMAPDIHVEQAESIVDGDRAAIHWVFAYTNRDGTHIRLDEIAYQEWSGGKIVRERFYYDPSQRSRPADRDRA